MQISWSYLQFRRSSDPPWTDAHKQTSEHHCSQDTTFQCRKSQHRKYAVPPSWNSDSESSRMPLSLRRTPLQA